MPQVAVFDEYKDERRPYLFTNHDLFSLFLPLLIEQMLEFVVGLSNSIMVASVGEASVSGVSLVEFVMALLISVFAALAAGGTVIVGQYMGRAQMEKAREAANQLVWFVGAVSIGIMVAVYALKPFILHTMFGQISDDVREHADSYLMIVALSIPFLGIYNVGAAIFRAMGNARLPMMVSLLMGIINVIGNVLAIYFLRLGTVGVAASTLISRLAATVIIMAFATKKDLPLRV